MELKINNQPAVQLLTFNQDGLATFNPIPYLSLTLSLTLTLTLTLTLGNPNPNPKPNSHPNQAAVGCLDRAQALTVPRARFSPLRSTEALLAL